MQYPSLLTRSLLHFTRSPMFISSDARVFSFAVLNAIGGAVPVGKITLPEREDDGELPTSVARDALRREKRVPVGVVESLHRVEFAPVVSLERVLRDPNEMYSLTARGFEALVAELLRGLGFDDVSLTPSSGDGGQDVLAIKKVNDIPIVFAFECKKYRPDRRVGIAAARALLGSLHHGRTQAAKGVLVTSSGFTQPAREFILNEVQLDSRDYHGLVKWLREYAVLQRRRP